MNKHNNPACECKEPSDLCGGNVKMTQDEADRLRMEQRTRELELADVGLAQELFNAYNEEGPNPWKTFDGRDVPRWDAINDQVRAKWTAVARTARAMFGGGR